MNAVLLSVKPKWCEKIASGEKTIEIRKTEPKCGTPFKCYIYESGSGSHKIIGEFICDEVNKFEVEFMSDEDAGCLEQIRKYEYDVDDGTESDIFETSSEMDNPDDCSLCRKSCVSFEDIKKYIFKGKSDIYEFYGWHISELKIYDKPKELSEYMYDCNGDCERCKYKVINGFVISVEPLYACKNFVKRPPQSWCYVIDKS